MEKDKLNTKYCNDEAVDELCVLIEKYGVSVLLGCFTTVSLIDEIKERIAESPWGLDNIVEK
jgi:hypothetical protein